MSEAPNEKNRLVWESQDREIAKKWVDPESPYVHHEEVKKLIERAEGEALEYAYYLVASMIELKAAERLLKRLNKKKYRANRSLLESYGGIFGKDNNKGR